MSLVNHGIIESTEGYDNFDFDVYHKILEDMKTYNKKATETENED
jgi:hypothetical protein